MGFLGNTSDKQREIAWRILDAGIRNDNVEVLSALLGPVPGELSRSVSFRYLTNYSFIATVIKTWT